MSVSPCLLVEPNAVTWDVERWWVNRPGAQRGARASQGSGEDGGGGGGGEGKEGDDEMMSEAERIIKVGRSRLTLSNPR